MKTGILRWSQPAARGGNSQPCIVARIRAILRPRISASMEGNMKTMPAILALAAAKPPKSVSATLFGIGATPIIQTSANAPQH